MRLSRRPHPGHLLPELMATRAAALTEETQRVHALAQCLVGWTDLALAELEQR